MAIGGLIAVAAALVGFGPKEPVDETITFSAAAIGSDVDAYLAASEAQIPGIIDGAQKQIVWADPAAKTRTPISLVYIHGFSASLEETRPMPDIMAQRLGANLFYTRLTGHGRSGDGSALAAATVNDWYNDTAEALAIGRSLGEKVIVVGVSTGATFATWAATKPELTQNVAGLVLLSPNYGVNNSAAGLLTLGAARHWVPLIAGPQRSFETVNAAHAKWWTNSYPTVALLPMMASVQHVATLPVESINLPALFIYHPADQVIRADIAREIGERWGSATSAGAATLIHEVLESEDRYDHVLAGRILSPANSEPLALRAAEWIKQVVQ